MNSRLFMPSLRDPILGRQGHAPDERQDNGQYHVIKPRSVGYFVDEIAAIHSITSSAMASMPGGMVRPTALAVVRLMTSSNLVGCRTGMSAGFSPLRMAPAYTPTWRYISARLAP